MEFRVAEIVSGVFVPVIDGEGPESCLHSAFLRDTQDYAQEVLDLIRLAREGGSRTGDRLAWGGNEMEVELLSDRATIWHYWLGDKTGEDWEISIPLDEAESLLLAWNRELNGFQKPKK